MHAETLMQNLASAQGWNEETCLLHALAYIENQGDNACFEDYLARVAQEENQNAAQLIVNRLVEATRQAAEDDIA